MLKWSILSLCAVLFPLSGFGRETAAGTESEPSPRDSVRQAYMDELDFIIDLSLIHISNWLDNGLSADSYRYETDR